MKKQINNKILIICFILIICLSFYLCFKKQIFSYYTNTYFNSIIDKIYVINMDKDTERLEKIERQLQKLNLDYKRMPGVNGKQVYDQYKDKTTLRPGQVGCTLSHINVLKDAIENNYTNILVLEDDVLFHKNFMEEFESKVKNVIKEQKRFDLLFLGCTQGLPGADDLGEYYWKYTRMRKKYYITRACDGCFAMIINKNIFQTIIDLGNKLDIPLDTTISNNILNNNKYKTFTVFPHIITSDVSLLSNTDGNTINIKNFFEVNRIKMSDFLDTEHGTYFNSIIDKIYVINMDKDTERLEKIERQLQKLNLDYKRILGINGKQVYDQYKDKTTLRPGQVGCTLSHINVLKDAIENNYTNILVLEDDVLFHKNFMEEFESKVKNVIKEQKRFDLLFLGCTQGLLGAGERGEYHWNSTIMKSNYYITSACDGTFAMIINKNIFQTIIDLGNKLDIPIDTTISNNILNNNKYKTFTVFPHIITSDVRLVSNTNGRQLSIEDYFKHNKIKINDFI